jgi:hypothetical protein
VQGMQKSHEKSARETHNMTKIRTKCSAVRNGKESKGQSHMRPDSRIGLSGRFTLEAENTGKICRKIILHKVTFRTHIYK